MVAISVDTVEESVALAGRVGIPFDLLADPGLKTALAYGVAMEGEEIAVPSVFVIARDRRIVYRHVGESVSDRPTPDDLLAKIPGP